MTLSKQRCVPCTGATPPLAEERAQALLDELNGDWRIEGGTVLVRRLEPAGYAAPAAMAQAVALVGMAEDHHADVAFGWRYCEIRLTTHAIKALSENDFIVAAKIDKLLTGLRA